jgi:hypothetical protein
MDTDVITGKMVDLAEDLAAYLLQAYKNGRPEEKTWRGTVVGTDGTGKNIEIAFRLCAELPLLAVGGHTDRVVDDYYVLVNAYAPCGGDLLTKLQNCITDPKFESAIARTVLHEVYHIFDPELADRKTWYPPAPLDFFHPREFSAYLSEFQAVVRVYKRYYSVTTVSPGALQQKIRQCILASISTVTY